MLRLLKTTFGLLILAANVAGVDMMQSRSLGMGRTVLLSQPTATDLINAPVPVPDSGGVMIEVGYHRRFELADLDHLFLASAYHKSRITVGFGVSQFGRSELYAEQLLKGSLTYHLQSISLGGSVSAMQVQIGNGYGRLQAATYGLGLAWSKSKFLFSLTGDNLSRPKLVDNGTPLNRMYTLFTEFQGPSAYSITGRIRWETGQKPQFGLGQVIRLSKQSSFFWGVATEPLEYGGGIEINIPVGSISYATSVHPVLGFSHSVSVVFRPTGRQSDEEDGF